MPATNNHKFLSGMCYISILFAPFFFPLIVWIISHGDEALRFHSVRAMKIQILSLFLTVLLFILALTTGFVFSTLLSFGIVVTILVLFSATVDLAISVYNIYYGLKLIFS